MSHYFTNEPLKKTLSYPIKFMFENQSFTLESQSGIFSAKHLDPGTELLIQTVLKESLHGTLLDLGCGYGPIGLTFARLRKHLTITLSDVNEKALELAKKNAQQLGLSKLTFVTSNGFEKIDYSYDTILLNPPIRAGKKVMYELYRQCYEHLNEAGKFYIVIRKDLGALSSEKEMKVRFKTVERLARQHGYHVYRASK